MPLSIDTNGSRFASSSGILHHCGPAGPIINAMMHDTTSAAALETIHHDNREVSRVRAMSETRRISDA